VSPERLGVKQQLILERDDSASKEPPTAQPATAGKGADGV
jgi:hypothetical protein